MVECTGLLILRTLYYRVPGVRIPPSPLDDRSPPHGRKGSGLIVLLAGLLLAAGCTSRSLTITSEPAGADVLLDNQWVGETPQTVEFRHGGVHQILLFKSKYETLTLRYDSERLLFDQAPFDLFTDLGPWRAVDRQEVHGVLTRSTAVANYDQDRAGTRLALADRAEILRSRAREVQLAAPPVAPLLPAGPPKKAPGKTPRQK